MIGRLARPYWSQRVTIVLAIAWLPYVSVLCTRSSIGLGGCPMVAVAQWARAEHRPDKLAQHHTVDHRAHGEPASREGSDRSCCKSTGKCNLTLTSSADTLPLPAIFVATTGALPTPLAREVHVRERPLGTTHDPPIFLHNVSLLI